MDLMAPYPNHMSPPLSYIDPTNVGMLRVYAGITPVSVGGNSIAGTIIAETPAAVFAAPGQGYLTTGQRMDLLDNEQKTSNLRYLGQYDWGMLEARAYYERVDPHYMDFGPDKLQRPSVDDEAPTGRPMSFEMPDSNDFMLVVRSIAWTGELLVAQAWAAIALREATGAFAG